MMKSQIELYDFGMLLSLFSTYAGKELLLCDQYSDKVSAYLAERKQILVNSEKQRKKIMKDVEFPKHLYNPNFYMTFGAFEVAAITFIEDFGIVPTLYNFENAYSQQFVLASVPKFNKVGFFNNDELSKYNHSINDDLKLIGICQIKISPLIKILFGLETVIDIIYWCHNNIRKSNSSVKAFVMTSLSWSDLIIVVKCNNYNEFVHITTELSDLTFDKLKINKKLEELGKDVLLKHFWKKYDLSKKNHIFSFFYTISGFEKDIFKNIKEGKNAKTTDCITGLVKPLSLFRGKSGHEKQLSKIFGEETPLTTFGDFNFLADGKSFDINVDKGGFVETKDFINSFCVKYNMITKIEDNIPINNSHTIIRCKSNNNKKPIYDHSSIFKIIKKQVNYIDSDYECNLFKGKKNRIEALNLLLRKYNVPKNLRISFFHLYQVYINGLSDPALFTSFIELYPYFEKFIFDIHELIIDGEKTLSAENDKNEKIIIKHKIRHLLINHIIPNIECLEKGVISRIRTGYHMKEITDYTVCYPGNFLHILTAINGLHRAGTHILSKNIEKACFTYIGNTETPTTFVKGGSVIEINWISLLQPEHLISLQHEVGHYLIDTDDFSEYRRFCSSIENIDIRKFGMELFADAYSYHFGFNRKRELFFNYHMCFLATTDSYKPIDSEVLIKFNLILIRMLLQIDEWRNDKVLMVKFEDKGHMQAGIAASLLQYIKEKFLKFHNELKSNNKFLELYLPINEKKHKEYDFAWLDFAQRLLSYIEIFRDNLDAVHQDFKRKSTKLESKSPLRHSNFLNDVNNGVVSCISEAGKVTSLNTLTRLLTDYLELLFEENSKGWPILIRNEKEGIKFLPGQGDYLFDPHGGSFILGQDYLFSVFKSRMALIHMINDFAEKNKIGLLEDLFRKKEKRL